MNEPTSQRDQAEATLRDFLLSAAPSANVVSLNRQELYAMAAATPVEELRAWLQVQIDRAEHEQQILDELAES